MSTGLGSTSDMNEWADFWRYKIGCNVIPADTREKRPAVAWEGWQDNPIPQEQHEAWKAEHKFDKGLAVIPGKVWHRQDKNGYYLCAIDLDNQKGIDEVCKRNGTSVTLQELAQKTIVEQHSDQPSKAHIYVYASRPFAKKSSDVVNPEHAAKIAACELPAIEVKGSGNHGIMFCSGSYHQNGHPYEIVGTKEPAIVDEMEGHIDDICRRHKIAYLEYASSAHDTRIPIKQLFQEGFTVLEGHNRHEAVLRAAESLIIRNRQILGLNEIKDMVEEWNRKHCRPPLPPHELEKQWGDACKFAEKVPMTKRESSSDLVDMDDGNRSTGTASAIVDLVRKNIDKLFLDQYKKPCARVRVEAHYEVMAVNSDSFNKYVIRLYYQQTKNTPSKESLANAISVLEAQALFDAPVLQVPLHLRVSWQNDSRDAILYDLGDPEWKQVKITKTGWSMEQDTGVLFRRFGQRSQISPSRSYAEDVLDRLLDLFKIRDSGHRLLAKAYIISMFVPDISRVILVVNGEPGSAKSTFCKFLKELVDPATVDLLSLPASKEEFVQQLYHHHVAVYDNLKAGRSLPAWFSDAVCRAATGTSNSKRELYSDDADVAYKYKRCVALNGISNILSEPDALDRSLILELSRIPEEERMTDAALDDTLKGLLPELTGYIFDTLVKALALKPTVKLRSLPRMADFAEWGETIARTLGYEEGSFIAAYRDNMLGRHADMVESDPLAIALQRLVSEMDTSELECTPTELLDQLKTLPSSTNTETVLPKSPSALVRRLRSLTHVLREHSDIEITVTRRSLGQKKNYSWIKVVKMSPPAPPSTVSKPEEE